MYISNQSVFILQRTKDILLHYPIIIMFFPDRSASGVISSVGQTKPIAS